MPPGSLDASAIDAKRFADPRGLARSPGDDLPTAIVNAAEQVSEDRGNNGGLSSLGE
jgi:hypothetical protein